LNDVKRVVCACKEASCADRALAQLEKSAIPRSPKTREVAKEIFDCRARLEEAERPTTDPDAEGSDTPNPPAGGSKAPAAAAGSAAEPAAGAAAPAKP